MRNILSVSRAEAVGLKRGLALSFIHSDRHYTFARETFLNVTVNTYVYKARLSKRIWYDMGLINVVLNSQQDRMNANKKPRTHFESTLWVQ